MFQHHWFSCCWPLLLAYLASALPFRALLTSKAFCKNIVRPAAGLSQKYTKLFNKMRKCFADILCRPNTTDTQSLAYRIIHHEKDHCATVSLYSD